MTKSEQIKAAEEDLARTLADPQAAEHAIRAARQAVEEVKRMVFAPGVIKQ